jgi:hypothetical protein
VQQIEPADLAAFRAGLRRRYSDEELLADLSASAARLGRSPTMREFVLDPRARAHPQTLVERFGSWNAAKRLAGLPPRRFATREDLLDQLRALGDELGRIPRARDLDGRRGAVPSKSLYWHVFGSLRRALREAGYDVPLGEERLERAIEQGARLARRLRRLPRFADWAAARRRDERIYSEWQVRRLVGGGEDAWPSFLFLVRARLVAEGVEVEESGTLAPTSARRPARRARPGAPGRSAAPRAHARRAAAPR